MGFWTAPPTLGNATEAAPVSLGVRDSQTLGTTYTSPTKPAVPSRVLVEVLLVVVLGEIEGRGRENLGGNRRQTRSPQAVSIGHPTALRRVHLDVAIGVDTAPILGAAIVALAHPLGGIVSLPERPKQRGIGRDGRVEDHPHHLVVPGLPAADLPIARVGGVSGGIAHLSRDHPRQSPEDALRTPEAAQTEQGQFHPGPRPLRRCARNDMRRTYANGSTAARKGPVGTRHPSLPGVEAEHGHLITSSASTISRSPHDAVG